MSTEQVELKSALPPELADKGWRLFMRDSSAPYVAENDELELSTGGYPNRDQAIERAREMSIEEEEAAAIQEEANGNEPASFQVEPGRRTLSVNSIRTDGGTQPRSALDMLVVADYKDAMLHEAVFPAVEVFFDGKEFWLADGFHRLQARKEADVENNTPVSTIEAEVRLGTKRDALLFALGANATHGLPRSREDKRRAVTMMLEDAEWSTYSDNAIAAKCQVSQPFVSKLRRDLTSQNVLSEQPIRRGTDGVARDTSNIGRAADDEDDSQASFDDAGEAVVTETAAAASAPAGDETASDDDDARNTAWTSEGIVELLTRHGGVLLRMQLEDMGVSFAALHKALSNGAIIQPETGKFTLPDHKPQPGGEITKPTSGASPKPKTTVEDLLKGKRLSVSFTWIPAVKGKVSVSVNMGMKPTEATRSVVDSDEVPRMPDKVLKMISEQIEKYAVHVGRGGARVAEGGVRVKKKVAAKASKKPSKKSTKRASKKTPARRKK